MPDINRPPYITLLIAPGIPESERKALELLWKEVVLDPEYILVVNYELYAAQIELPKNSRMLIVAPDIPLKELDLLRKRVDVARSAVNEEDRVVVCNYDCTINVVE